MRRDLPLAAALLLLLAALTPAYSRVLPDGVWRGPVLLAALLAVAAAAGVRALRAGPLVAAGVSALGLTLFAYVTVLPDVGLLPDATSWSAYLDLFAQAAVDLREQRAPAPTTPGFLTALVTGTWLVAHASHELLVRLRTPGAALVPPIVLWALPLAIPLDGSNGAVGRALPFLAAAGLVLLLGGDADATEDEPPRITASGLTVGTAALAGAVVAPLLLPGYGAAALLDLEAASDPRGYQPIVDISERLQRPDERDVLLVRSDRRSYLRLAGLDSFDGDVWRLGPAGDSSYRPPDDVLFPGTRPLPPEEPAGTTTSVFADIEVLDLANIYVPAPYQPTVMSGPLSDRVVWSTEGGFLATWDVTEAGFGQERVGVTQGVNYRVEAERPTPTIDELRQVTYDDATRERWTQLPGDPGLVGIAEEVYARAGADTPVDQALALQSWFTEDGRFTYDLDVPPLRGADQLVDFVTTSRTGYCEQFATAMAVMLRETGIPARVAVGFLPGEVSLAADPDADRDLTEYTVRTTDAHAWVEVLFPGSGWVAFEPTPRDDGAQFVPTEDDLTPDESLAEREERTASGEDDTTPEPETPEPEAEADEDEAPAEPAEDGADDAAGLIGERGSWAMWVGVPLLLGLLGLGAAVAVTRRRVTTPLSDAPADRIVAAQRQVLRTATELGIGRTPSETVPEAVARWRSSGRIGPEAASFVAATQRAAFAGDATDAEARTATDLGDVLRGQLRDSATRTERWVAPLRPTWERTVAGAGRLEAQVRARLAGRPVS